MDGWMQRLDAVGHYAVGGEHMYVYMYHLNYFDSKYLVCVL